jgi:hypothetical protein
MAADGSPSPRRMEALTRQGTPPRCRTWSPRVWRGEPGSAGWVNRAWAAVASSGVASNYLVTLEVSGRKSGRIVSLPLVMVVVDGQRYLVSMLGDNVQWSTTYGQPVEERFSGSGGREEIQLEEVPTDQRAPILMAYLQRAPGARPHVPVNKNAALALLAQAGDRER